MLFFRADRILVISVRHKSSECWLWLGPLAQTVGHMEGRFVWLGYLFFFFFFNLSLYDHILSLFGECSCWSSHVEIKRCLLLLDMVFSIVWCDGKSPKPHVFLSAHITLRQKSGGVSLAVSPPSHSHHVTLNSHEVLEHFQTKAPCYPAGTDGLPTPNLSEKTKEDSNRKSKTEEKCTSPNPHHHHHHPFIPAGRWWARAASVPLSLGQRVALLTQPNKIVSTWWRPSHFDSVDFILYFHVKLKWLEDMKNCINC